MEKETVVNDEKLSIIFYNICKYYNKDISIIEKWKKNI